MSDGQPEPPLSPNNHSGIRGRYAPSPSGPLHLGNARTALIAWLQIRVVEGRLVLRIEDLDRPRTKPGSTEQILDDLTWLGLDWDEGPGCGGPDPPYRQSERDATYARAFSFLEAAGLLYPCICSRKDISEAASAPHQSGRIHLYPGTCRNRSPGTTLEQSEKRRRPAWRYRVPDQTIAFTDRVCGPFSQHLPSDVGDYVLRRNDGLFSYQLAVVVDDIMMGITDVVRGADLLDATPRQIELFHRLGHTPPDFWHVPLMMDGKGARLSKRDGAASIAEYRERGGSPETLVGTLAASLGLVPEDTVLSARELAQELTPSALRDALRKKTVLSDAQPTTREGR